MATRSPIYPYVLIYLVLVVASMTIRSTSALAQNPRSEGTREMAAQLDSVRMSIDPAEHFYVNSRRVRYFRDQPQPESPPDRTQLRLTLARELLRAGSTRTAIDSFTALREDIRSNRVPGIDRTRSRARWGRSEPPSLSDLIAISYLRLGEQQNCLYNHTAQSCIFPIRRGGVHEFKQGSRSAARVYERILERNPDDLEARWLLNVAYMTLGRYPEAVPSRWRIPSSWNRETGIGYFPNVGGRIRLARRSRLGGSVAADFDRDGDLDVLVSSWGLDEQIRYFENLGNGRFADRTEEAGLLGLTGGLNLIPGDYDNDGYTDVFVLRGAWLGEQGRHPNSLLHNDGDGSFSDRTRRAGLLSFHPTQTGGWADYDGDGDLDLFVGNETTGGSFHPCTLYRNDGDGTFTEVGETLGLNVYGFVKAVAWGDYDNDGDPDLYLSLLDGPNMLFENRTTANGGEFEVVTREAGLQEPRQSFPAWFWDYDNDGWLDLFVSGYHAGTADVAAEYLSRDVPEATQPRLYHNDGDGTFTDVTEEANLDRVLLTMGSNYGDLDNDGRPDLYAGTGDTDFRVLIPNRMFWNRAGERFREVTAAGGFGHLQKGHGVSFADLDNDGDQDVLTVMGGAFEGDTFPDAVFANPGHGNHWIKLRLVGRSSNRAGIGARIRLELSTSNGPRTVHHLVSSGGSFGANPLRQEIGLGDATGIERLVIRWPASGQEQVFEDLRMDRMYRVDETSSRLKPVDLPSFSIDP